MLADIAHRTNALLVHYSTDYVFDGGKVDPYVEDDLVAPLNRYGEIKLAAERAIVSSGARYLIFRTSWVYGQRGKNFLNTILRLAHEREELRIVSDQIGAPTWSRMIAQTTASRLSTGNTPGRAMSTAHACALGSAPNAVAAPEKIFDVV